MHGGTLPSNSLNQTNLDSFVQSPRPQPQPLAISQEIRDRGSIFVANLYQATSTEEARSRINHVKHVVHGAKPASHEIAAWRCMVLKHGRSGLGGPDDFELSTGSVDDGENWAGGQVLKVMQMHAVIDAVVIVSRWYGGMLLGSARFSHIKTSASEVCQEFKRKEALQECISTLTTQDAQPSPAPNHSMSLATPSSKDYSDIDLAKGKRLIKARESAIKSIKLLLVKRRESRNEPVIGLAP